MLAVLLDLRAFGVVVADVAVAAARAGVDAVERREASPDDLAHGDRDALAVAVTRELVVLAVSHAFTRGIALYTTGAMASNVSG